MVIKPLKSTYFVVACAVILATALAFGVHAAITPSLTLSNLSNGQIQANIQGDSNAQISLYYYTQYASLAQNVGTIGYTGANGYLSTTLSYGQYNIPSGASVYVMVDGAVSATTPWPNYTNSTNYYNSTYYNNNSSVTFSQNNITITLNQSMAVTLYGGSGSYYISQNSSLASASISGSTLTMSGVSAGSGSLIICSSNNSCGTIYLTVTSNYNGYSYTSPPTPYNGSTPAYSYSYPASNTNYPTYPTYPTYPQISLSQSYVTLYTGQQSSLNIYGSGQGYFIYSNSNSNVVTVSVSGNTLWINGNQPGMSSIMVCETVGSSCTTIYVTISAIQAVAYPYTPSYSYTYPSYSYTVPTYSYSTTPIYYYTRPQPVIYSYPRAPILRPFQYY